MNGKIVGAALLISGAAAGAALYYLQLYGYYREVPVGEAEVALVSLGSGLPEVILADDLQAIDADSSPIRYRACFTTSLSLALLSETYETVAPVTPRNAPDWFDCFDAELIDRVQSDGTALTFMGQKNISYGVDRIVVITEEGRGYMWHELNACGEKSYDGTVIGEACPERPKSQ